MAWIEEDLYDRGILVFGKQPETQSCDIAIVKVEGNQIEAAPASTHLIRSECNLFGVARFKSSF